MQTFIFYNNQEIFSLFEVQFNIFIFIIINQFGFFLN